MPSHSCRPDTHFIFGLGSSFGKRAGGLFQNGLSSLQRGAGDGPGAVFFLPVCLPQQEEQGPLPGGPLISTGHSFRFPDFKEAETFSDSSQICLIVSFMTVSLRSRTSTRGVLARIWQSDSYHDAEVVPVACDDVNNNTAI